MTDHTILRSVSLLPVAVLVAACNMGPAPGDGPVGQTHAALCSAVTLSPSPGDAAPPGASITWTADATCQFANPELELWVLDPTTGTWSVAQAYSTSSTYTWQVPSVAIGSVYNWQIWAREAGSTAGYEAWAQDAFTVTAQPCTGVSAAVSPTSGVPGTQVTITSSETGCPAAQAEYEIWALAPGGSSYDLLDPYSTSASYTWDTTGATPGTWDLQVWARNQGASNGYDSWAGYTYDVVAGGGTPCSAVSTATSPWFVAEGTSVTLASSATGCTSPEYEVWSMAPGGSWQILQTYAASAASYVWTAPTTTGTYDFQVWARDASSSSTYDAWDTFALTVNAQPTVSATTSPAGTATAGAQVTITSSSTGLPNPEYAVYYEPPGASSYQLLQSYSASASYVWDTSGATAGTYNLQVWARQQGDGDTYDALTSFTYDLQPGTPCGSVSTTASPNFVGVGTPVTLTSTATTCGSPEYAVWVLPPGGSWEELQTYSASASYVWTPSATGTYDFQVWARDESSSGTYDAWDTFSMIVNAAPTLSVTENPSGQAQVNSAVTFHMSSTGLSNPQYAVYYEPPGASSYQLLQSYTTATAWGWNTNGLPLGTYQFQVWAVQGGDGDTYDVMTQFSYGLYAAPCYAVSTVTSPSTIWEGQEVTLTSSATVCLSPEFEVWSLAPGASSYQLLQPYSSSNTYVWNTTGATPGTYDFQVWAENAGSGVSYQAYDGFTVTVNAQSTSYTTAALCCSAGQKKISPLRCASTSDPAFGCGAAAATPCSGGHATWGCSAGACAVVSCDAGFADCDGNPANGCEVDLTSTSNCGSCGVTCGSTQICTPTGCGTSCPSPLTYCNGSCIDLTTSLDHCGACGTTCSDPVNGVATCSASACGISCNSGYTAVSGKCYNTASDPTCCGSSCTKCPAAPSGGDMACISGACTPVCESGWILCNGGCVDPQTDVTSCGGCDVACSGVCVGGACQTPANEVIATTAGGVNMMVADGTSVFWIGGGANIMQVDRAGTTAPITLASGQQGATYIAVDSTSVYWVNHTGGGVFSTPKGTPGANFVANATSPNYVAVNSSNVYYDNNQRNIYSVAKGGGTPQQIWTAPMGEVVEALQALAVDDSYLWGSVASTTGSLWRSNLDGTNATYLANTAPFEFDSILEVVLGSGNVLYSSSWSDVLVESTASPAGPDLTTVGVPVAVDTTYAYVINGRTLMREGICGGPAETMSTGLPAASVSLAAADAQWLYWVDSSGNIRRRAR